jgi:hypothetical protein
MKKMYNEYLEVRRKYPEELRTAIWQNLVYGMLYATIPTFIASGKDIPIIVALMLHSTFLSVVLNRDKYKTRFGRFVVFPTMFTLGAYIGFKIAQIISNFI